MDAPTGDGTEYGEIMALQEYIQAHMRRTESLMRDIRRDSQANRRWNKVPRGGGKIAKQIAKSEAAMEGKIEPRNCELLPITPASAPSFSSVLVSAPVMDSIL